MTYPVPPRTVLLGLVGAVLGLEKDTPQQLLADARLAVGGELPKRFWHKTNVRKIPARAAAVLRQGQGSGIEQRTTQFPLPAGMALEPALPNLGGAAGIAPRGLRGATP